jgi:cysteine desulfurase/selenocysteine lyase
MGTDPVNVALIPSVSTAAGFVAAQLGVAPSGEGVVIGEQEYSSNHFPWRQLARKGYEVRQVPFRNGGLELDEVSENVDAGTRLVAFSGVQSATGHRSDIAAISALRKRSERSSSSTPRRCSEPCPCATKSPMST